MKFYIGLHHPAKAKMFERAFISVNAMRGRKKPVACDDWIMDSGAFTEIATHGGYRHGVEQYANEVNRLASINPGLKAVVSQDWMCEPWMVEKTGLTVAEHQRRTIERYDDLLKLVHSVTIIPVLQGYGLQDYLDHIDQYGDRLKPGIYVGVGSVCKRNGSVKIIEAILSAIHLKRPDLKLHGFGIKTTSLGSGIVRECLYSADSMAWSFAARKKGDDANDPKNAQQFIDRINTQPVQLGWIL